MWLASILQQLYFISWKDRKDSCAVFGNESETGQEWPSPKSFKFFVFRGLPTSHVKVTAWWRSSLPLRNSGGRLWRRIGDWEGEAGQGCWGVSACTRGLLASARWAVAILLEQCLLTFLAASFSQELGSCFSQHHLFLCLGLSAAPLPCQHQVPTLPLTVLLQSTRQS